MDYFDADPAAPIQPSRESGKLKRLVARMGLGAFTISLIVHVGFAIVAIFFLYKWVDPPTPTVGTNTPGGDGRPGSQDTHKIAKHDRQRTTSNIPINRIHANTPQPKYFLPESSTEMPGLTKAEESPTPGGPSGPGGPGKGPGNGPGSGTINGPQFGNPQPGIPYFPKIMKGRCTSSERLRMVQEAGGTAQVEQAVEKSLQWFKGAQNPNGSWGKNHSPAMTGFALLCYLGHCEGTQSTAYGDTVTKGITYLINLGMKNNGRLIDGPLGNSWPYEHAIATYALSEALTFSRGLTFPTPELETTVEKAVSIIVKGQTKQGGWYYGYEDNGKNDLSVVGWQMQALKAAKASNVKIDDYDKVMQKAVEFLSKTAYVADGKFAYTGKSAKPAMTGVGVLCLQQHEKGNIAPARDGIKLIMDGLETRSNKKPKDTFSTSYGMDYDGTNMDLYATYYAAQVMRNAGGREWKAMNEAIIAELLPAQNPDGSFKPEAGKGPGSSSVAGASQNVYVTALNTLILEVYYRFLPTSAGGSGRNSTFEDL